MNRCSINFPDKLRLNCGIVLSLYARWVQSLIPALLTPKALIEFNYKTWVSQDSLSYSTISYFASESWINSGFSEWENNLLMEARVTNDVYKKILVLFCGSGRLPIAFAKLKYQVTGVDFNARFIELAKKKAEEQRLSIEYLNKNVLDIKETDFGSKFNYCFIPYLMYSTIPTIRLRKALLKKIYNILDSNGRLIFDLQMLSRISPLYKLGWRINKTIGFILKGNLEYQLGDTIKNFGFYHFFRDIEEIEK